MKESSLQQKPFLDYSSQIRHLQNKGLTIDNPEVAINILKKVSYYSLINGYKDVFKNPDTHLYYPGTTFNDIYQLYRFDSDLRAVFLKYILVVEKNIKSSISYHFSSLYGNGIAYYTDKKNYEYGNHERDILYLFKKMNDKIRNKHVSPQIEHYLKAYHDIPLWVLVIDLTMGEIATMYRYLKGHCKTLVCNDFHGIGRSELSKMLIILTKYRNICAHSNRLYNTHTQDSIPDLLAHKKLKLLKDNERYVFGKSDLFAALISLKYLLSPEDFRAMYYELKRIIRSYSPSENILNMMGFPNNWMSILRIKVF